MIKSHGKIWIAALVGLLLCGCAQKLTYERWQSIHDGEHADAVKATLGDPMERLNMGWMYMDPDRGITANIYFENEKVIGKTWSDPERGMQGKSPNVNKPGDVEHHNYKKVE